MSRYYILLIPFICSILFLGALSAGPSVEFNTNHETIYSDYYGDILLTFTGNDLTQTSENSIYYFELLNNPRDYYDISTPTCNPSLAYCKFNNNKIGIIIPDSRNQGFNYILNITTVKNYEGVDNFQCNLSTDDGLFSCDSSAKINVLSGEPVVKLKIFDYNLNNNAGGYLSETQGISKNNRFQIRAELGDNSDDKDTTSLNCDFELKKGSSVITPTDKTSFAYTDISSFVNLVTKDIIIFDPGNTSFGAGSYSAKLTCYDGASKTGLDNADTISFSITDKPTKVDNNSITFDPDKVYPDTKIKCAGKVTDEDDTVDQTAVSYSWTLNGTQKSTNQEFNCSDNSCKSGDTLTCKITPTGTNVIPGSKQITVSSHISSVTISSPVKLQVSQEDTFNANVNYNGTGTVTYSWSFGDGTTATGKSVKHAYADKGDYSITLNVSDGKGSTNSETKNIDIVDADLIITVKSPVVNQEVVKGDSLNVKVGLNDNTGTPILDSNVIAKLTSGDKTYNTVQLRAVSGSPGLYEGTLAIDYLGPIQSQVEITANYNKAGVKLYNKKSVPVSLTAIDSIMPVIKLDTKYIETKDDSISVGNVISAINICFKLPNNTFDDQMQGKVIISAFKDYEFKLDEMDSKCYNIYPEYKVQKEDLDSDLTIKFKDVKDSSGNYVKVSTLKKFDVLALPKIFDVIILEPVGDKLNLGQTIGIKAKVSMRENNFYSDLKDLKAIVLYSGKNYDLTLGDQNNEKVFYGGIVPNVETKTNFTVTVSGTYKGALVEETATKSLDATNEMKIELISPNSEGVIDVLGKIIIAVKYQNNIPYEGNNISLKFNDKNTLFTKITEGKYAGFFEADNPEPMFLRSGTYSIKGQDEKGNTVSFSGDLPIMGWKMPMFVYYIFLGFVIVFLIVGIVLRSISKKQKQFEKQLVGKTIDELQDELTVAKQTLSELQRKFFKQEISEDAFKEQKIELEKRISLMEGKIKVQNMQENKTFDKAKNFVDNKMPLDKKANLEQKLNLQSDVYTKYKEEIDTLTAKLKSYKDKYSPEDMRVAIKQSKELPEDIIDKIIQKIYD